MTNSTVQHSNSVSTWNWNIAAAYGTWNWN